MTGDVDLEQVRWDLQVATGQTVAGTGVEGRMREARAAAGRLAAGLPALLDELEQLRRPTPAEPSRPVEATRSRIEKLAKWLDFQFDGPQIGNQVRGIGTEVERLSAELAAARAENERLIGASGCNHLAKVEWFHRAVAAERALEAVREWAFTVHGGTKSPADVWPGLRAALSAASPTTSDDEQPLSDEPDVPPTHGLRRSSLAPVASTVASDEPARCPHGVTEAHDMFTVHMWPPPVRPVRCPGPAASGTPETTR